MSEPAIKAEGLSKSYRIGHGGSLLSSLRRAMAGSAKQAAADEAETLWALRDVSFQVAPGEVVGIIGRNGAGKSTLLKVLSRITQPTTGRAVIRGRVSSLLEVGTGFHPELTGRENIYMNGAILGMRRSELQARFDEIVEFSGVERFIDTPLKRYSSGMQVRLAFAVAAHIEPEVLIIDEVLAVGDATFQRKCLGKIGEVASGGRTVLFVSHQMTAVQSLCTRALLMADGRVARDGAVPEVIEAYLASSALLEDTLDLSSVADRSGLGELRFAQVTIWGERDGPPRTGGPLHVRVRFEGALQKARPSRVGIAVSSLGTRLFTCSTELTLPEPPSLAAGDEVECALPELPLGGGRYTLTLFLEQAGVIQDWLPDACQFEVLDADYFGHGRNAPLGHEGRTVLVEHAWTTRAAGEKS